MLHDIIYQVLMILAFAVVLGEIFERLGLPSVKESVKTRSCSAARDF